MTPVTFFEKFELLADVPGAVAKMRELVLRLSMQGKLSEARTNDIPVSELLQQVEAEKKTLGIETKATNEEAALLKKAVGEIPARWTCVCFGDIACHNAGKTLDKGRNRGELRDYITTSNIYWGSFNLD